MQLCSVAYTKNLQSIYNKAKTDLVTSAVLCLGKAYYNLISQMWFSITKIIVEAQPDS